MYKKTMAMAAFLMTVVFCTNSWSATTLNSASESNTFSVTNRNMMSGQPQQNQTTVGNGQNTPPNQVIVPVNQSGQISTTPSDRNVSINPINQIDVNEDMKLEDITVDMDVDVDDPGFDSQYYLAVTNSYLVWAYIEDEQDETVYVAVLDTGVDYDHVDLENRVDEDSGYDFVNDDDDPMDDNGHGTHVAGIIAAEMDNGEGIVGVTGNLDVVIIPIKVLDEDGTGDVDDVVDGIEYAIEQDVDVINISFGSSSEEDEDDIKEAIEEAIDAGIFVVVAAGNDTANCDDYVPTSYDDVYTVGATSTLNLPATFTNYGDCLEILAPGEKILSTTLDDTYEAWDGTSMSAPIISGIAAMMLAYDEDLTVDELTDLLNDSGHYLDAFEGYTYDGYIGYGLVDAAAAYEDLTGEDIYEADDFVDDLEPEVPTATANNQQKMNRR